MGYIVNKFEQVRGGGGKDQGNGRGMSPSEQVQAVVTWIPLLPREQKDRQTRLKTLPFLTTLREADMIRPEETHSQSTT